MTIAQVIAAYPPYLGGMGRVAHQYTTQLRSRGYDVHVFTPRSANIELDAPFVHRLRGVRFGNAAFVPALDLRVRGFDLVHLHYPFFGGAEPLVLGRMVARRPPLVVTYHMDATARGVKGTLFRAHQRLALPFLVSHADRILVSSWDYARASALAQITGALDRVEVHPFGVDLEQFHPGMEPALRASLGIRRTDVTLLFVGALDAAHHFKGLEVLLQALAGLRHLPQWRLIVVGDGPMRPAFERMADGHNIASLVTFVGEVSQTSLPRYYRLADVHVFPSTGAAEAFGLVVIEAAASGLPSIASELPGVRTVVLDGETGLRVPPGDPETLRDAIQRMLQRPELRQELGRRARERAEKEFAWGPLVARLEATYQSARAAGNVRP